jgi:hypothetical protein
VTIMDEVKTSADQYGSFGTIYCLFWFHMDI